MNYQKPFYSEILDKVIYDLTLPLEDSQSDPNKIDLRTIDHVQALEELGLDPNDFPDGYAISNDFLNLSSHSGTHVDAPLHYGPKTLEGRPAMSIDQLDLSKCLGKAVCLDLRHCSIEKGITFKDLKDEFSRQRVKASDRNIILLWTGSDKLWGQREYFNEYPGLTKEACEYLLENQAQVIGIDAWGLDKPAPQMIEDFHRSNNRDVLWPAHVLGRTHPYLQIEKLCNLETLPHNGEEFGVALFPIPIVKAGAGWSRVFAFSDPL